jgi:hypothetical protein
MNLSEKLLYKRAFVAAREGRPMHSFTDEAAASDPGVNSLSARMLIIDAYAAYARGVPRCAAMAMLRLEKAASWRKAARQTRPAAGCGKKLVGYNTPAGVIAAVLILSFIAHL